MDLSLPWLHQIDPVLIKLGPIAIHWYALMYIGGAVVAFVLGRRRAAEAWRGVQPDEMEDLVFWGMLGVIIGGRLGYMLFYGYAQLAQNPLNLLKVWEGGMSFHGGLLGVIVAMLVWARRKGRHGFDVLDFLTPLGPIGLGLGRLGNFIGGELWGRQTDSSLGVIFPSALPPMSQAELLTQYQAGLLNAQARHPSQLYQALIEGVLLFVVVWWFSSRPRPRYAVSGLFLLLYGLGRFAVEFVREPDAHLGAVALNWMSMGQLLSLPMVLLGGFLLVLAYTRKTPSTSTP
jgi:phosphatidylglycerol:prolipoprotein diacylglycerol transferase